jgi:hypothetical protein
MVCSARPARCGPFSPTLTGPGAGGAATSDVLLALLLASVIGIPAVAGIFSLIGGTPAISGTTAAAIGAVAGGFAAAVVYVALVLVIFMTFLDRCATREASSSCISGGVKRMVGNSDPSYAERLFAFTMMHNRVDLVTQSEHWSEIEDPDAFVFCTSDPPPETSEILRCYYFDPEVCAAGLGATIGGAVAGLGGIALAVAGAAAIGCATIILCVLALLFAILIVAFLVLLGASIGGAIGRATAEDHGPFATISPGNYLAVRGPIRKRGFDSDANVMWFTLHTDMAGNTMFLEASTHCDINDLSPACL